MSLNRGGPEKRNFDTSNKFLLGFSRESADLINALKKAEISIVMDPISGQKYIDLSGTPLTMTKTTRPESDLTIYTLNLDSTKIAVTSDKNSPHDKRTTMHVYDIAVLNTLVKKPSQLVKSLTAATGMKSPKSQPPVPEINEDNFFEWDPHASLEETIEDARKRWAQQETRAINKVKKAFAPLGHEFDLDMVKEHWFGANQFLKFDNEFADALIYLVTGRPVISTYSEDTQLGSEVLSQSQRKSIPDALHEISQLDDEKLACLIKLYHKGMTGESLRSWHWLGNEVTEFTRLHADALNVLVLDQDMAVKKAIETVHDASSAELTNILSRSQRYGHRIY